MGKERSFSGRGLLPLALGALLMLMGRYGNAAEGLAGGLVAYAACLDGAADSGRSQPEIARYCTCVLTVNTDRLMSDLSDIAVQARVKRCSNEVSNKQPRTVGDGRPATTTRELIGEERLPLKWGQRNFPMNAIYTSGTWRGIEEPAQKMLDALDPPQLVLKCSYRQSEDVYEYHFWYEAPPSNIKDILGVDANGILRFLGTQSAKKCPDTRQKARDLRFAALDEGGFPR